MLQDLRYALRGLRKTPTLTLTVIVVLALGVGANAAMYSLVDRLFFREPSGIVDPENVLTAREVFSTGGYAPEVKTRQVEAIRNDSRGLASIVLESRVYGGVLADGPIVVRVSDDYFPMLGARLLRGRTFTAAEAADSADVAIVSYRYWQHTMRGDTAVLARSVEIARQRYTVIGVASPGFSGTSLEATDIWLPLSPMAGGEIVLRKRPGVSTDRLDAALTLAIRQSLPANLPTGFKAPRMKATPLMLGRQYLGAANPQLQVIVRVAGVAAIILLVAIANIATLLLMRAERRRREIAVRLALGVSRARLVRQFFVEGALLSLAGATVALVAGVWGAAVARSRFLYYYRVTYPLFDWRFAAFTLGVAITAGVLASLAPAVQATRPDLTKALSGGVREGHLHRSWVRGGLVVTQTALSVVLVVGAALFVRSLQKIHGVVLGIDVDPLLFAEASFNAPDSARAYVSTIEQEAERIAAMPGVQGAALSFMPPLRGEMFTIMFRPNGDTLQLFVGGRRVSPQGDAVGPGYFATVGVHLLDGRDFTSADQNGAQPVMIVSQTMARLAWPNQRAVGQCLVLGRWPELCAEVVGVVSDASMIGILPRPEVNYYEPVGQARFLGSLTITVRGTARARRTVTPMVSQDLSSQLPASTSLQIQDLKSSLDPWYAQWTEGATVLSAMGLLALLVTAIGMYSIIGYSVSQRTHEIGVRVALGARAGQVMRPVIFAGVKLALLGVALGLCVALALGRVVASLLYGTSPRDPVAMIAAASILVIASVAASFVPALRASRVDPVIALRAE